MQKVAWPMITVIRLRLIPSTWVKVLEKATPVTIPGRAIGRTTRKEIESRPKNLRRPTASAISVPNTIAISIAARPASTEWSSASRTDSFSKALPNQLRVKPGGGHLRMRLELKASTAITSSGM
jgi:hypothetical protein